MDEKQAVLWRCGTANHTGPFIHYDEMFLYSLLRIKRHLIALYLNGAEVQRFTQWEYNNA